MPKNSVKQIEKDGKKIIDELIKNANKSINDIAETCHFSRQKVWRVINNLERNHTIWGYVPVLDEEKLGKKNYIMLIKRSVKPMEEKVVDKIINSELEGGPRKSGVEITNSVYTNGDYDWILSFNVNDLTEAKAFVEFFNKLYEGYISEVRLIEKMFTVVSNGVTNPEIEKLKYFLKV